MPIKRGGGGGFAILISIKILRNNPITVSMYHATGLHKLIVLLLSVSILLQMPVY